MPTRDKNETLQQLIFEVSIMLAFTQAVESITDLQIVFLCDLPPQHLQRQCAV